jgi:hypothetical protein
MNTEEWLNRLGPLVTCSTQGKGQKIKLVFSLMPPSAPGVYVVCQRRNQSPFYVGETSNLLKRLTFLFRCNSPKNLHPCHTRHRQVHESAPSVKDFCDKYAVRWLNTEELTGRLEIEEMFQVKFDTNKAAFYEDCE